MSKIRIGLDIDGVIANFAEKVIREAKKCEIYKDYFPKTYDDITNWHISKKFYKFMENYWSDEDFWMDIKVLNTIDFTPTKYITARPISNSITRKWLKKHKFPTAKLIQVSKPYDKIKHLEDVDIFIDDYYGTIEFLRSQGICAYLFEAPYQSGYDLKHIPKISSLKLEDIEEVYGEEQFVKSWLQS